jgi:hypothetical protein
MASSKKRKIDAESTVFQEKWAEFLVLVKDDPVCLICKESVAVTRERRTKIH